MKIFFVASCSSFLFFSANSSAQKISQHQPLEYKSSSVLETRIDGCQVSDTTVEADSITVGDYLAFLKTQPTQKEQDDFYDDAMGSQILRTSEAGQYHYIIAEGVNVDDLMLALTPFDVRSYDNWIENETLSKNRSGMRSASPLMMFGENEASPEHKSTLSEEIRENNLRNRTGADDENSSSIVARSSLLSGAKEDDTPTYSSRANDSMTLYSQPLQPPSVTANRKIADLGKMQHQVSIYLQEESARLKAQRAEQKTPTRAQQSKALKAAQEKKCLDDVALFLEQAIKAKTPDRTLTEKTTLSPVSENNNLPFVSTPEREKKSDQNDILADAIANEGVSPAIARAVGKARPSIRNVASTPLSKAVQKAQSVLSKLCDHERKQKPTFTTSGSEKLNPVNLWKRVAEETQQLSGEENQANDKLKSVKTSRPTKTDQIWNKASVAALKASKKIEKLIEAKASGNQSLVDQLSKVVAIHQHAFELFINAAKAHTIGTTEKIKEGDSWFYAGTGIVTAAKQIEKIIEAKATGNPALAAQLYEIAHEHQNSSELYTKAAEARSIGTKQKINEALSWHQAGSGSSLAAHQLEEKMVVIANHHPELIDQCDEIISENQLASQLCVKAAEAYMVGTSTKMNEANHWYQAGLSLFSAVAQRANAIDIPKLAAQSNKLARKLQQRVDRYVKKAEAIMEERNSDELRAQIEQLKSLSSQSQRISGTALDQEKIFWSKSCERLKEAIKNLENAMTTTSSKNVMFLKEAAAQHQKAAEQSRKAAEASAQGNTEQQNRFNNTGNLFFARAQHMNCLAKMNEATESGNTDLAQQWRDVVLLRQVSGEFAATALQANSAGQTKESDYLATASWSAACAAAKSEQAIEAHQAGNASVASLLKQVALQYERSIDPIARAAKAEAQGKGNAARVFSSAWFHFYNAADQLCNAIEEDQNRKPILALLRRNAAKLHQCSVDSLMKEVKARIAGKKFEGSSWLATRIAASSAAHQISKVIELKTTTNNKKEAAQQNEAAYMNQQAVTFHTKAAELHSLETAAARDEGSSWDHAGITIFRAAGQKIKAITAKFLNNEKLATQWNETRLVNQRASDFYVKAATAKSAGTNKSEKESFSWHCAGKAELDAGEQLSKAIEARINGNELLAVELNQSAKINQAAAQHYANAAKAYFMARKISEGSGSYEAVGERRHAIELKINEAYSWYNAGLSMVNSADDMSRATEASIRGDQKMASNRNLAIRESQLNTELYVKAAEAYARGNEEQGNNYKIAADSAGSWSL